MSLNSDQHNLLKDAALIAASNPDFFEREKVLFVLFMLTQVQETLDGVEVFGGNDLIVELRHYLAILKEGFEVARVARGINWEDDDFEDWDSEGFPPLLNIPEI